MRRGEHGTRIVFWKPVAKTVVNDQGEVEHDTFPLMRDYVVFNAEQCEGGSIEQFCAHGNGEAFVDYGPAEEAIRRPMLTSGSEAARPFTTPPRISFGCR